MEIRACLFDVFGTVVDWRTSVSREFATIAKAKGLTGVNPVEFAVEWRKLYHPSMEEVRSGRRPFVILDVLHRESLMKLVARYALQKLTEADIDQLNRAWHRLDPWHDAVAGLTRLKRKFIIAPCSNGNIALMVGVAKHAGLPWDCILGAEIAHAYKPTPEAYLASCRALALAPANVLMVAAHNADLKAAKATGLATAFVARPREHGPGQTTDLESDPGAVDIVAKDFVDLAAKLGA